MQLKIIHGTDAENTRPRESRADAVHEGAARGAEVVGHGVAGADGAVLAEGLEVVAAAQVSQVRVGNGEVGCEHGSGNLMTV